MVEETRQNPTQTDPPVLKARKRAMIKALEKTLGIVSEAAKRAKIDRSTHYEWLKTDEEYRRQVESCENLALDLSESKLLECVQGVKVKKGKGSVYLVPPNIQAITFHLSTKGKKRGYIKTIQLEDLGGDGEDDEMDTTLKV